jgi:hypothetical protein
MKTKKALTEAPTPQIKERPTAETLAGPRRVGRVFGSLADYTFKKRAPAT